MDEEGRKQGVEGRINEEIQGKGVEKNVIWRNRRTGKEKLRGVARERKTKEEQRKWKEVPLN